MQNRAVVIFLTTVLLAQTSSHAGTIYGISSSSRDLVAINTVTGVETVVDDTGIRASWGLSFSPVAVAAASGVYEAGTLFGHATNGSLYVFNPLTGNPHLIGATGLGGVESLTFDLTGRLFAAESHTRDIYQISTVG
jgi:hypothetical protein